MRKDNFFIKFELVGSNDAIKFLLFSFCIKKLDSVANKKDIEKSISDTIYDVFSFFIAPNISKISFPEKISIDTINRYKE
ncbi:hypothetical protein [Campylobacter pinnipediorum]|uniref:hypothetical protein n=1 Tax=Campylobacter pinnipediorum TaxID=1965231 RepID=UPI00138FB040|nr:hypothetical protein [Campylobacter pinnipediorum]